MLRWGRNQKEQPVGRGTVMHQNRGFCYECTIMARKLETTKKTDRFLSIPMHHANNSRRAGSLTTRAASFKNWKSQQMVRRSRHFDPCKWFCTVSSNLNKTINKDNHACAGPMFNSKPPNEIAKSRLNHALLYPSYGVLFFKLRLKTTSFISLAYLRASNGNDCDIPVKLVSTVMLFQANDRIISNIIELYKSCSIKRFAMTGSVYTFKDLKDTVVFRKIGRVNRLIIVIPHVIGWWTQSACYMWLAKATVRLKEDWYSKLQKLMNNTKNLEYPISGPLAAPKE